MVPENFTFSQSSLQAHRDCPRRFWLAYVEQLPWPAVEAAPVQEHEQLMRLGERFHRLVERSEISLADPAGAGTGMDPELVAVQAQADPDLAAWYAAYRRQRPADLPTEAVEIERLLSVTLQVDGAGGSQAVRLAAQYDLIAAEKDGRVIVVDWKTGKRMPTRAVLHTRMQTLVYPFVLVEASTALPWGPVRPEQVEMRYWFTVAPGSPMTFTYDGAQHDRAREALRRQLAAILAGETQEDFPKVEDTPANRKQFCNFCVYRSRCDRGSAAGDVGELLDPSDYFSGDVAGSLEFTMAEVEELAF
jgi:RecB family exonuclease